MKTVDQPNQAPSSNALPSCLHSQLKIGTAKALWLGGAGEHEPWERRSRLGNINCSRMRDCVINDLMGAKDGIGLHNSGEDFKYMA